MPYWFLECDVCGLDALEYLISPLTLEGRSSTQKDEGDHTQRPDIDFLIVRVLALDDFWSHVERGPEDLSLALPWLEEA